MAQTICIYWNRKSLQYLWNKKYSEFSRQGIIFIFQENRSECIMEISKRSQLFIPYTFDCLPITKFLFPGSPLAGFSVKFWKNPCQPVMSSQTRGLRPSARTNPKWCHRTDLGQQAHRSWTDFWYDYNFIFPGDHFILFSASSLSIHPGYDHESHPPENRVYFIFIMPDWDPGSIRIPLEYRIMSEAIIKNSPPLPKEIQWQDNPSRRTVFSRTKRL